MRGDRLAHWLWTGVSERVVAMEGGNRFYEWTENALSACVKHETSVPIKPKRHGALYPPKGLGGGLPLPFD